MKQDSIRIAMWSGPRNISTAMMRAFENRRDTTVIDEPFYAHYLSRTGADHPGKDDVLISQSTDWNSIIKLITGPVPNEQFVWYQKHMVHHVVGLGDLSWVKDFRNCFLIRHPIEVINSYCRQSPIMGVRDLGFIQQVKLFDILIEMTGDIPIVCDAKDILISPKTQLELLCERLEINFSKKMLSWPSGHRDTDGIWAPYWYQNVERSTGFMNYYKKNDTVPTEYRDFLDQCVSCYEYLSNYKLQSS